MQTIQFAAIGRTTTRLGFGGSSVMGVLNRSQSLAILECAYDAGIRHFDTAPYYGFGESEACFGEFLARHRSDCTITTKFGIPAQPSIPAVRLARDLARPILQRSAGIKRSLQSAMNAFQANHQSPTPLAPNPIFTAAQARTSVENSLRNLKTDHIDLLLLHDIKAIDIVHDAANDELLRMLESFVASGAIGAFGIGSERAEIAALLVQHPRYCSVVQCEWSVFDEAVQDGDRFYIHHRSLSGNFKSLHARLNGQPELLKRWSEKTGQDLADPGVLANLMIKAALIKNPTSIVLFSSKQPAHIHNNVAVAENARLEEAATRLFQLVHSEAS
jgi:D-threo-aldose 1-dehydrogenase